MNAWSIPDPFRFHPHDRPERLLGAIEQTGDNSFVAYGHEGPQRARWRSKIGTYATLEEAALALDPDIDSCFTAAILGLNPYSHKEREELRKKLNREGE